MSKGIVYVALGDQYIQEALTSVESLRKHNDLPVQLITDYEDRGSLPFEHVVKAPYEDPKLCKIYALRLSAFDYALLLDTDTYILGNIQHPFELLDKYNFASVLEPRRPSKQDAKNVPATMYQAKTCALYFKKCGVTTFFCERWVSFFKKHGSKSDQVCFRQALWDMKESLFWPLPNTYGLDLGGVHLVREAVKILHGRGYDYEKVEKIINHRGTPRMLFPDREMVADNRHLWYSPDGIDVVSYGRHNVLNEHDQEDQRER